MTSDTGPPILKLHMPDRFSHWFCATGLGLIFRVLGRMRVTGLDNIPATGPILFCPNHTSDGDPPALYAVIPRRDVFYMGKQELFEMFASPFFRYHGGFPVKRNTADRAALRTGESILKAGNCLVLFPEGGISETGLLRPLLPGAAMIAINTGAPIIPVGITGTSGVIPYGKVIPRFSRKPVTIEFGKAIKAEEFEGLTHKEKLSEAIKRIEHELRRMTGQ